MLLRFLHLLLNEISNHLISSFIHSLTFLFSSKIFDSHPYTYIMESVVPKVRALPISDEKLAVGQTDIIIICWKSDGKNLVR